MESVCNETPFTIGKILTSAGPLVRKGADMYDIKDWPDALPYRLAPVLKWLAIRMKRATLRLLPLEYI